jgi:hypothetical protein
MRASIVSIVVGLGIALAAGARAQGRLCMDGVKDGLETDVDCGGASACRCAPGTPWWACYWQGVAACELFACGGCPTGRACNTGGDCESQVCRPTSLPACVFARRCAGTCSAPTCSDHIQNGDETGVDCGGCCPPCETPPTVPTCSDGVQNQGELGIDCGGPCSPKACCDARGRCTMFVTSVSQSGDMSGVLGADDTCNSRAHIAGLPGHYQAWLCDGIDYPAKRSTRATVPYVRTDGVLIAQDWSDLTDGQIASPLDHDEFGNDVGAVTPYLPWTHVATDGTCADHRYLSPLFGPCSGAGHWCPRDCASDGDDGKPGWTSSSPWAQGDKGDIHFTDFRWTDSSSALCSEPAERIYCIEQ